MVKIAADRGIPGVLEALSPFGEVRLLDPRAMRPANLAETDILIVRSVVKVGKEMLFGTPIRMVGSATAGTDHVDKTYLSAQNIAFSHAPGANADSVADHVITAILRLAARTGDLLRGKTLGVVGYGQVGTRVTRRAQGLGLVTMICDPPLADEFGAAGASPGADPGAQPAFRSLQDLLAESDILTLHTPLVSDGRHPTRHLLNGARLAGFRGLLINTSRGGVVDNAALRHCIETGTGPSATVLDVWEGEPTPDPVLVKAVDLGTAHVAGYAADSKWEATRQMAAAVARFLTGAGPAAGADSGATPGAAASAAASAAPGATTSAAASAAASAAPGAALNHPQKPESLPVVSISSQPYRGPANAHADITWLADLAHTMCPLRRDHDALRRLLAQPDPGASFEAFRANYPGRRLMRRHRVSGVPEHLREVVESALTCRCD